MKTYLDTPLWNIHLTEAERLQYLLSEMTITEKLQCLGTGCPAIPRLGVPSFHVGGEGAHGVQARHDQGWDLRKPDCTTIFPNPIGMSATWDPELIRQAGRVTGTEARGLYAAGQNGCLSIWAPTIDMERDPRWGRTEEGYGEDPVLAGAMAGAYVEGMQGEDPEHLLTAATVKHFYANNVEEGRCWKSSAIDARNREEYYLEPFRRVIQEHGAEGLMTAYNEINGIPCMLNPEVRTIAKEQWGLHHVVCDGGDVSQTVDFHHYFTDHAETIAAGLEAGIDCFTDEEEYIRQAATDAYERGMITEAQIDEALYHHFGVMLRLGLFDPPGTNPYEGIGREAVGSKEHHRIARQVAAEAVVLLQNDGVLPLAPDKTVAAIGPQVNAWYKDWYSGIPPYFITPAQGLKDALGDRVKVVEDGITCVRIRVMDVCACRGENDKAGSQVFDEAGDARFHSVSGDDMEGDASLQSVSGDDTGTAQAAQYLGVDATDGTIRVVSYEEAETFQIEYWGDGRITLRACSNGKLVTTRDAADQGQNGRLAATSQEAFGWFVKEIYQLSRQENDVVCELRSWNGTPIGFDEQGCLCVPMETAAEDVPEEGVAGYDREAARNKKQDTVRIGLETVRDGIAAAAKAATQADITILYLGPNPMINCKEEIDRTHLNLPEYQQHLMESVYAANPNTVLVLVSSIPFAISWAKEHIPAILNTASGGMELGHGIADVLTGDVSPAARLPMTWYRSAEDLPPMDDYDIIRGERTYQYYPGEVLYPFGHGLTYSGFDYEDLTVEVQECQKTDFGQDVETGMDGENVTISPASGAVRWNRPSYGTLRVKVRIRNIQSRTTDEVVQVYGRKIGSVVKRPRKTLLAFVREKQIAADEMRTASFDIPLADLCYYSEEQGRKVLESGVYEIMVGASSEKICLRQRITLSGE